MRYFLALLFIFSLQAQEPKSTEPLQAQEPKPTELQGDWWKYFESELPEKTPPFENTLREAAESATPENQEKANALAERAITNLKGLEQLSNQPLNTIPTAPILKKDYSVDDILQLYRNRRKVAIELGAKKADLKDNKQQIATTERYLQTLLSKYNASAARSEEKLLLGLQIVTYRSSVELAKKRLEYLENSIDIDSEILSHFNEELKYALDHISATPERMTSLKKQIAEAESNLILVQEKLNTKKIDAAISISGLSDEFNEANDQLLTQEVMQVEIEEALAHNKMLLYEIEKALIAVVSTPDEVNVSELDEKIDEWAQILNSYSNELSIAKGQVGRQLRNASQILSLYEQKEKEVSPLLISLQKKIIEISNENAKLLQQLQNDIEDNKFLLTELDDEITSLYVGFDRWFREAYNFISRMIGMGIDALSYSLINIGRTPVTVLSLLRFFLIIGLTILFTRLAIKAFYAITYKRRGFQKSLVYRISRLLRYFLITLGIILAFWSLGFDFSYFFLIAGALGVGLGFGLQSIFNNFISGLIILFESYLKVGDFIELEEGHLKGEVRAINVSSIVIRTNDGIEILVPNSDVIGGRLINWTLNDPFRRIHIPFSAAYGSDKQLIKKIVEESAKNVEFTLQLPNTPTPQVRFVKFGDSSLDFELAVWVNERASRRTRATISAYLFAIDDAFREHKIIIPFPQRDVHMKQNN